MITVSNTQQLGPLQILWLTAQNTSPGRRVLVLKEIKRPAGAACRWRVRNEEAFLAKH